MIYCLQRNNKLVWDETVEIMEDLFRDVWEYKESVTVDNALDITFQVCRPVSRLDDVH